LYIADPATFAQWLGLDEMIDLQAELCPVAEVCCGSEVAADTAITNRHQTPPLRHSSSFLLNSRVA
jgi:hypothetical protein